MSLKLGLLASSQQQAAPLLLDVYPGAAAAYSLRKLRAAYTGAAIRVKRSSDNTEIDIGFSNGELNITALLSFCGSGNGLVSTWYDQSGNGRNGTTINVNSNFIVMSGLLQTINSKPAISIPKFFVSPFTVIGDLTYFIVQRKISSLSPGNNVGSQNTGGLLFSNWNDGNIYFQRSNGTTGFIIGASDTTTGNQILSAFNNSASMSMYKNNNIYTLNLNTTFSIGDSQISSIGTASTLNSTGLGSELIIYTNSQLSNRTGINTNINSYYTIY